MPSYELQYVSLNFHYQQSDMNNVDKNMVFLQCEYWGEPSIGFFVCIDMSNEGNHKAFLLYELEYDFSGK